MSGETTHNRTTRAWFALLLKEQRDAIEPQILSEAAEFLDNHEYGLALETIAAGVLHSKKSPTDEIVKVILHLSIEMDLFDEPLINELYFGYARKKRQELFNDDHRPPDSFVLRA